MLLVVGFGDRRGVRHARRRRRAASALRAFLARNPPLLAVVLGLVAPASLAPEALVDLARALAVALIAPLGFFALGVILMVEREEGTLRVPAAAYRAGRRRARPCGCSSRRRSCALRLGA